DTTLSSGTKSGYSFVLANVTGTPASTYSANANPLTANQTGVRYFCSIADAVIRVSTAGAQCVGTETPLQ
ncbi:MAG: pili assembly chaperone, partial [Terriglobales bacterium]